jgi:ribosomal protein S18 acetylase RimI-like enzyme
MDAPMQPDQDHGKGATGLVGAAGAGTQAAHADHGALQFSEHDTLPSEQARIVDDGLGEANDAAAPLHEVQPLAVFVTDDAGRVIGGAIGRTWGASCELQQLWVHPAHRRRGLGAQLVRRFETRAAARGVRHFYLETWTFQAPRLYGSLGYRITHTNANFPHGLAKFMMERWLEA